MPSLSDKLKPSANGHASVVRETERFLDAGLPIVPCVGKVPCVVGFADAPLEREAILAALQGPGRNIALALHHTHLIDVECDTPEAEAALQAMFPNEIPPTPTWRSARGLHRFFVRPHGLPKTAVIKLGGIEFRIGNGRSAISVLPPSVHPETGQCYEWLPGLSLDDVEPAPLPEDIADRLRAGKQAPAPIVSEGDIPEGRRNDELFKLGCGLARTGIGPSAVEAALRDVNAKRCKPPLTNADVAGIARSASKPENAKSQKTQTHAQILTDLALANCDLWRTPAGLPHATIKRDGQREHWRLRSGEFKQWLGQKLWESERIPPGAQTLADVINVLEGKALFDGPCHPEFVRVAGHDDAVILDLCDPRWRAIVINLDGWRVADDPLVRFRRAKGMLPLAEPARGGSLTLLRQFVNVSDEQWPLLLGWLLGALRPFGPYPILKMLGEQGSAKTTTGEVLRAVVDPNSAPFRRPPRTDRDLMIAAANGWVVAFDNLSYINPDLSDALCCLASGSGFATRKLYSDDDETILVAERPIILNGIEDMAARSDLLDRCVILDLPRIEPGSRRDEHTF